MTLDEKVLEEIVKRVVRAEREQRPAALDEATIRRIASEAAEEAAEKAVEEVLSKTFGIDTSNPLKTRDALRFAMAMQAGTSKVLWHGFLVIVSSAGLYVAAKLGLSK